MRCPSIPWFPIQVAPEGGEEVDKRALFDKLKTQLLEGAGETAPQAAAATTVPSVQFMVENKVAASTCTYRGISASSESAGHAPARFPTWSRL